MRACRAMIPLLSPIPVSCRSATLRYYFTAAELNGQAANQLKLYHFNTAWQQVGSDYTYSESSIRCRTGYGEACWLQAKNVNAYSPFVLGLIAPTAVNLASFSAAATSAGVTVAWITGTEIDSAGFNLERAEAGAGPWTRLNSAMIPAAAPGSSIGSSYTWDDSAVVAGRTYSYRLEAVDLNGATVLLDVTSVTYAQPMTEWLPLIAR